MIIRLLPAAIVLLLPGCIFTGLTFSYSKGDSTIAVTAYTKESGKRVVTARPSK